MKTILHILFVFFTLGNCFSQLSGFKISYGIAGVNSPTNKLHFPSHQLHFDYNQYLARSISAGINVNYQSIQFKEYLADSIAVPRYSAVGLDVNFKWWFLNDFRLFGKMAASSCKGRLVALSYNFRMYLSLNFGYHFNVSNLSFLNKGTMVLGGGLGINFWQFGLSKYGGQRIHQGVKHILIPFAEIQYLYAFNNLMKPDQYHWKAHQLPIKIGVKLAFTYF